MIREFLAKSRENLDAFTGEIGSGLSRVTLGSSEPSGTGVKSPTIVVRYACSGHRFTRAEM